MFSLFTVSPNRMGRGNQGPGRFTLCLAIVCLILRSLTSGYLRLFEVVKTTTCRGIYGLIIWPPGIERDQLTSKKGREAASYRQTDIVIGRKSRSKCVEGSASYVHVHFQKAYILND
jgi:hypothetical protein